MHANLNRFIITHMPEKVAFKEVKSNPESDTFEIHDKLSEWCEATQYKKSLTKVWENFSFNFKLPDLSNPY